MFMAHRTTASAVYALNLFILGGAPTEVQSGSICAASKDSIISDRDCGASSRNARGVRGLDGMRMRLFAATAVTSYVVLLMCSVMLSAS